MEFHFQSLDARRRVRAQFACDPDEVCAFALRECSAKGRNVIPGRGRPRIPDGGRVFRFGQSVITLVPGNIACTTPVLQAIAS